jgi:hydroxymethylglutaryl-CoA reductase
MRKGTISGFSKKSKAEKIAWIARHYSPDPQAVESVLEQFWQDDPELQQLLEGFSENTLTNYPLPYGIAPNFLINERVYALPMVIEESSVVAAASSAAKFWLKRGGIRAEVLSTTKVGQVHFYWSGRRERLQALLPELKTQLLQEAAPLTANMESRGGGITGMELIDFSGREAGYFQLRVYFETCDSMGANFINSVLESFARTLQAFVRTSPQLDSGERKIEMIMAILSNYTPQCVVRTWVRCPVEALADPCHNMEAADFADRFSKAVRIAELDPYRATTHNKGIFNGVDAVVLATGNDFRAVEACGHTHAARDGQYTSLSHCALEEGQFHFWLDLPLALGTVGGLTQLHPLARLSLQLLGKPSAPELMTIVAAAGLAQNFAALRSLVTTGIQHGHMKMHLQNILHHFGASEAEARRVRTHFDGKTVSFIAVRTFLERLRVPATANKK